MCPLTKILIRIGIMPALPVDQNSKIEAIVASLDAHALRIWREGHHTFFLLIQLTTIELRRSIKAADSKNYAKANLHFDRASILMLASAAAMRIAGDVDRNSYAEAVVPSMMRASDKFSGSNSADHGKLVDTYKALNKLASNLPKELEAAYSRFESSVKTALGAHICVCAFHRGGERSSTGSGGGTKLTGVETLIRIGTHWLRLLAGSVDAARNKFRSHLK